jgi:hypothetical protein
MALGAHVTEYFVSLEVSACQVGAASFQVALAAPVAGQSPW